MHRMDGIIPAGHAASALLTLLNLYQLMITFFRIQSIILVQAQALKVSSSFKSYSFNTQILRNDDSRLLSNSYRSVIGISSYIAWCDTEV